MEIKPFQNSILFDWIYNAKVLETDNFGNKKPVPASIIISQGGTSSGKTYSILQVLLLKTCEKGGEKGGIISTVAGQDMPNLRDGTVREFDKILLNPFFSSMIRKVNRSTLKYTLHNGAVIEFKSFDNEQDARNGKRDFLFINEANGISYQIYEQLQVRTEYQTYLDYNPSAPFWVHTELLGLPNCVRFISNYKHNGFINNEGEFISFLSQNRVANIEAKKSNKEWWRVYGCGLTGKVSNVIFPEINWIAKMPDLEDCKRTSYGLDFGYTNDETALVRVSLYRGELYAEGLIYKTGLKYKDIGNLMNELNIDTNRYSCYADNDPRGIDTLKDYGIYCKKASKGQGSIIQGIHTIKEYKLNIKNNPDWKSEQMGYTYKISKLTGKPDGENPSDKFNHYFDALRYGIQGIHNRNKGTLLAKNY